MNKFKLMLRLIAYRKANSIGESRFIPLLFCFPRKIMKKITKTFAKLLSKATVILVANLKVRLYIKAQFAKTIHKLYLPLNENCYGLFLVFVAF